MKKLLFVLMCSLVFVACKNNKKADSSADGQMTEASTGAVKSTYAVTSGTVNWTGKKPTGAHSGTVNVASGTLGLDKDHNLVSGDFVMDMTSITVTDLTGDDKMKLEGHLKNADFFAIDSFPTAEFKITKVMPVTGTEGVNCQVIGDLTIKGITNAVTVPAEVMHDGNEVTVKSQQFEIDRTEWGIQYNSKKILGQAADNFIYDAIDLTIQLNAKKQ